MVTSGGPSLAEKIRSVQFTRTAFESDSLYGKFVKPNAVTKASQSSGVYRGSPRKRIAPCLPTFVISSSRCACDPGDAIGQRCVGRLAGQDPWKFITVFS